MATSLSLSREGLVSLYKLEEHSPVSLTRELFTC